ncbi:hypothetical protein Gogos_011657, partial [Gossypium gossypioides]|nr:hypothetical protein [Gossypium gossypioides]
MGLDLGYREIEIKGDSLIVVNKVDVIDKDRSAIGAYIEDIKALKGGFGRCKYMHVVKGSNGLAHILVIEGIKRGTSSYSLGGVSKFAEMAVERDKRKNGQLLTLEERKDLKRAMGGEQLSTLEERKGSYYSR